MTKTIRTALIATAMVVVGCGKEPTQVEQQGRSEAAIGRLASNTASFLVEATKDCRIIGVDGLNACAKQNGTLVDEKFAKVEANSAIKKEGLYWERCRASFTHDYCNQLLDRAIRIEWRKPPETVDGDFTTEQNVER
jgi:hypothetical protein